MRITIFSIALIFAVNLFSQSDYNQFDAEGLRHGNWKKSFEGTKELRYEGQFDHGKEIGLFKFYKLIRKKSQLTATKQFNANNNLAYAKYFAIGGKVISEGNMNAKLHVGKWVSYHKKSTQIMTIENYLTKVDARFRTGISTRC